MILFLDGFDHYSTAQMGDKWGAVNAVVIDATAGRNQSGAAYFDASITAFAQKLLSWGATSDPTHSGRTAIVGHAWRPLTISGAGATLLQCLSANGDVYAVRALGNRSLQLLHMHPDTTVEVWGTTAPGIFQTGFGYRLEVRFTMEQDGIGTVTNPVTLRLNDQVVLNPPITAGALQDTGPFNALMLGGGYPAGGVLESGTWWVDDLYVLNGKPAPSPMVVGGVSYDNASFLGNMHARTVFPARDGSAMNSGGNTPWTPFPAPPSYATVNSPIVGTDDVTYDTASPPPSLELFTCRDPLVLASKPALPVWGVQLVPRVILTSAVGVNINAVIRRFITGALDGDVIGDGPGATISWDDAYRYLCLPMDRDPSLSNLPFDTYVMLLRGVESPGDREAGLRLVG